MTVLPPPTERQTQRAILAMCSAEMIGVGDG
jgi:hypothetical protein